MRSCARLLPLALLVAELGCAPRAVPAAVSASVACASDAECSGGLCVKGQCRAPCADDADCDAGQLCIELACVQKIAPTIAFPNGGAFSIWVNRPPQTIAPTITLGPQADSATLRWSVILAPPDAPAIAGTEPGAAARDSIIFDPQVPGYYAIEAVVTHRGGSSSALLLIDVNVDTTYAYFERAGMSGATAIRTDGTFEVVATGGNLATDFSGASARLDADRVAFAYLAQANETAAPPQAPDAATTAIGPNGPSNDQYQCANASAVLFVDGAMPQHLCCPVGKSNLMEGKCCPPGYLLRALLPAEIAANGGTQTHECFLETNGEASIELRIASPSGKGEKSLVVARRVTAAGDNGMGGATCSFDVAPMSGSDQTCEYGFGNLVAANGVLFASVLRQGNDYASAVIQLDPTSTSTISLGRGATPQLLPASTEAKTLFKTTHMIGAIAASPNGARLLVDSVDPAGVTSSDPLVGTRNLRLIQPQNPGPGATLDLPLYEARHDVTGDESARTGLTRYFVEDDGRVTYLVGDSMVRRTGPNLDTASTQALFEPTLTSGTLLPDVERAAVMQCWRPCAAYDSGTRPPFGSGACSIDKCCTCLTDHAEQHDPAAYCHGLGAVAVVAPAFAAIAPSADGKKIAVLRTLRTHQGATCDNIFNPPGSYAATHDLVIHDFATGTSSAIALSFLPADVDHQSLTGTTWLAGDLQIGFYARHGVDKQEQFWVMNADGSNPKQLLPSTARNLRLQGPVCATQEATPVAAAIVLLYALWLGLRRRTR